MAFNIKIPFVIASHVKKFTSTSSFKNKSKAGAIGMISGVLYVHNGTSVLPVVGDAAVTASSSATVALTAADCGKTFLFDRATGLAYTLPAAAVGLQYNFIVSTLQTSGNNDVITSSASIFMTGAVGMFSGEDVTPSNLLGPKMFAGNGSSHLRVRTNGTTTGGGIGSWFSVTCIAATLWFVQGVIKSPSGTIATPFSV